MAAETTRGAALLLLAFLGVLLDFLGGAFFFLGAPFLPAADARWTVRRGALRIFLRLAAPRVFGFAFAFLGAAFAFFVVAFLLPFLVAMGPMVRDIWRPRSAESGGEKNGPSPLSRA